MTTMIIFGKKNTANCNGELSGTLISAQAAVWFGKLVCCLGKLATGTNEGTVERLVCSDLLCHNGIHANPQHEFRVPRIAKCLPRMPEPTNCVEQYCVWSSDA